MIDLAGEKITEGQRDCFMTSWRELQTYFDLLLIFVWEDS